MAQSGCLYWEAQAAGLKWKTPETGNMEKRNTRKLATPTHDEVAAFAHMIWEKEGKPEGRHTQHWHEAEAQLKACYEHESGPRRRRIVFPAP